MGGESGGRRRRRTENWSMKEKRLLLQLVKQHLEVVEAKETGSEINTKKARAWWDITHKFLSMSVIKRTPKHIKDQWRRLKVASRRNIAVYEKNIAYGIKECETIDDIDLAVKDMLGPEYYKHKTYSDLAASFVYDEDENDPNDKDTMSNGQLEYEDYESLSAAEIQADEEQDSKEELKKGTELRFSASLSEERKPKVDKRRHSSECKKSTSDEEDLQFNEETDSRLWGFSAENYKQRRETEEYNRLLIGKRTQECKLRMRQMREKHLMEMEVLRLTKTKLQIELSLLKGKTNVEQNLS